MSSWSGFEVLADKRVDVTVWHARGFLAATSEGRQHGRIGGRLVDLGVLALGVEQDHRVAGIGRFTDHPAHCGGLPAAGGPEHSGMTRKDTLAVAGDLDVDCLVAGCDAELHCSVDTEDGCFLV